jgi:hypothetical protein
MGITSRGRAALVASAALTAAWGCGETREGNAGAASRADATVTGRVTIKGKPAAKGRITFEPVGVNGGLPIGSNVAQVGKDGAYTVTTKTGSNDVTVSSTGDPAADSGYNKTSFEVQPGSSNTLNLDLPIKP